MGLDATARRRWFGALMLLCALGLLVIGETVLKGRLEGMTFLMYWMLCFVFTGLAVVTAYFDARALQTKTRREARELLENTLNKIQRDAQNKPRSNQPPELN
jgi:hypothetical protein